MASLSTQTSLQNQNIFDLPLPQVEREAANNLKHYWIQSYLSVEVEVFNFLYENYYERKKGKPL